MDITVYILIGVFAAIVLILIIAYTVTDKYKNKSQNEIINNYSHSNIQDLRGVQAEQYINSALRQLLKEDEFLLNNLLLPLPNGHKTEVDSVLISRKVIFCIEIKNWVGHISGSWESEYWCQKYDDEYLPDKYHRNLISKMNIIVTLLERY